MYNKITGAWFTVPELENIVDAGQMSLYADLEPLYATSQRVKDVLSPFKETYNFTTLVSGVVIVPDTRYLNLSSIQIYFQISDRRVYYGVDLANDDTLAERLNSQVNPPTVTSPVGEQVGQKSFRLYPASAYNGNVTYLRRPIKPVFGYNVISGRVVVYNPNASVQLEWEDSVTNQIVAKALSSVGINLTAVEIAQYAEQKSMENYQGVNHL